MRGPAFFAYADNYLIDVKFGIIMDVEASRAIRQAEVGAARDDDRANRGMLRHQARVARCRHGLWFGGQPRLAGQRARDRAAHSGHRQVEARGRHLLARGLHLRQGAQHLHLPGGQDSDDDRQASQRWTTTLLYRASAPIAVRCPLKPQCCPKAPARKIPRSIYEEARDVARALAKTEAFEQSRRDRKRVEMLFAHLKRILRLGRLRLRGPRGAQFEFTLAAIAQNLRRLAKLDGATAAGHVHRVRCVSVDVQLERPGC